jgi:hypothetical protein
MIKLCIEIESGKACELIVRDRTGYIMNAEGFVPETTFGFLPPDRKSPGGRDMYRLKDVNLFTMLYYNSLQEEQRSVRLCTGKHYDDCGPHDITRPDGTTEHIDRPYIRDYHRLVKDQHFHVWEDGWYSVIYFCTPTREWFESELLKWIEYDTEDPERFSFTSGNSRLKPYVSGTDATLDELTEDATDEDPFPGLYSGVFFSYQEKEQWKVTHWQPVPQKNANGEYETDADGRLKYWKSEFTDYSFNALAALGDVSETTLIWDRKEFVSLCNLKECWYKLAKKAAKEILPCANRYSIPDNTKYRRDFLKMTLDVIGYSVDLTEDGDYSEAQRLIEGIDYCGLCAEGGRAVRERCGCV